MAPVKNLKGKLIFTAVYSLLIIVFIILKLPCFYMHFFGIPCPGCGMTRAFLSALRLDFAAAFKYHFMFWSVPVFYIYFIFDFKLTKNKIIDRTVMTIIPLGFLVNWVVKLITVLS